MGCGDDAAQPIGCVAEHDHAGRGHVAHAQLRDAPERELLVERAVEQLARLGQQRGPGQQPLALRLGPPAGRHVAHDHDELAPALDVQRGAADLEVDPLAVAAPQRERLPRLDDALLDAGQHARANLVLLVLAHEIEHRVHRCELGERVAAELLERRIGEHAPAVQLEHDEALAGVGERVQQRLVAVGLLTQGDAGRASLGHVGQDEADADRLAVAAHRPVRGDPVALGPADLDLAERRPRAHDPRRVLPHRRRQVGQKLLERVAARAGDLGEPVVDAQ